MMMEAWTRVDESGPKAKVRRGMESRYAAQVMREGVECQWDAGLIEVLREVLPATC